MKGSLNRIRRGKLKEEMCKKNASHHTIENCKSIETLLAHGEAGLKNDYGMKGGMNAVVKICDLQYLDNMKGSFIYPSKSYGLHNSKVTSIWGKSLQTASSLGIKSGKPVNSGETPQISIPHGSLILHSKQSTNSPWNRMAWANVWGKGSGITSKDVSKQVIAVNNTGNVHGGSVEEGKPAMNGMGKNPRTTFPQPPVSCSITLQDFILYSIYMLGISKDQNA